MNVQGPELEIKLSDYRKFLEISSQGREKKSEEGRNEVGNNCDKCRFAGGDILYSVVDRQLL
jgi:hypothetical protein